METDLNVTGRPAQFGRGIMQGVAAKLLEEFATRLEREIAGSSEVAGAQPTIASTPKAEDALDLGSAARGALGRRAGLLAGAAGLVLLAVRFLRRGR